MKRFAPAVLLLVFSFSFFNIAFAQDECTPVGWVTQNGGVTGGGNVAPTVCSTYTALRTALLSATVKVVHISGVITIPSGGRITMQDLNGKTVFGLPGSKLVSADLSASNSGILYVKRCRNIIFRNIVFEGPGAYDVDGWDNMTLDASTNIWIDHCEFQDGLDGNLDIKAASDYVSVTWCKFVYNKPAIPGGPGGSNDHRFSNLFGSSDDDTGDRGKLRITMQYCWWAEGCRARMPRVRFGKVHMVNNLFNSTAAAQCIQAGFEADLLIENNVFENVKSPIDLMSNNFTAITARDNIFSGTTGNTSGSGTAFTPPYTLNIIPAYQVKLLVSSPGCGAGASLQSPETCGCGVYALNTAVLPAAAAGTITKTPNKALYAPDSVVTITATPNNGFEFVSWSGDATGSNAVTTVTMNTNKNVTANFQQVAVPVLSADALQPAYSGISKPFLTIPSGSGKTAYVSGVLNDPTDPAAVKGIVFTISSTSATMQVTSSNTTVVPLANIVVNKSEGKTIVKIIPAAVGYSTIGLTAVNSAGSSAKYTISYAASAASKRPAFTTYHTSVADASGASAIDSNYMFIADDETNVLRLYNRSYSGKELYSFDVSTAVGATEEIDIEASSVSVKYNAGKRLYWMGSLGNSKSGALKPDRNRVIATDITGNAADATLTVKSYSTQFRSTLINWGNGNGWNFTASAASGMIPKRIDGFNIEGLAVAQGGELAYIGFRAPCVPLKGVTPTNNNRKYAVLAPVTNFETIMNTTGPSVTLPTIAEPVLFDLDGLGIRSIERLNNGHYIIVAGLYTGGGTPAVYIWDGVVPDNPGANPISITSNYSKLTKLYLEGLGDLAQVSADGELDGHPEAVIADMEGDSLLHIELISDNGTVDYYNDGIEAKALAHDEFKKFRKDKFDWSFNDSVRVTINIAGTGTGTVTINPPGGVYTPGTAITLTANAVTGGFAGWSGGLTGFANPATFVVTSDKNITATFSLNFSRKKIAYVTDPSGTTYSNDTKILPALYADTNLIVTEINANQTGIDYSPYDAIIFSEVPNSVAPGVLALRGINKPMLMMKVHSYRTATGAWGWTTSTTAYGQNTSETNIIVSDTTHPIFKGVNFVNGNEVKVLSSVVDAKGLTYMNPASFISPANGAITALANIKNNPTQVNVLQMPAGISIAGITVPQDFIQIGINSSSYATVTADGVKMVLNAVYWLTKLNENYLPVICASSPAVTLYSSISGASYQWQMDTCGTGNCFENITNNTNFSGTNSKVLQLNNIPSSWNGYRFRCLAGGSNSNAYTLKFTSTWTGAVDNNWHNPGNWSCNAVPDENTDVIVNTGTPVISADAAVRSLQLTNGAQLLLMADKKLLIKQ
jgi:pectate lyase